MSIYEHQFLHKDNPIRLSHFNKKERTQIFKVFDELSPEHSKSERRQELCENWIVGMGYYDDDEYFSKEEVLEWFCKEDNKL